MEEAVTFSGQQARQIFLKEIKEVIALMDTGGEPKIHHLLHHCTEAQWESIVGKQENVYTE